MPLRFSPGFSDQGLDSKANPRSDSRAERIYNFLCITHTLVYVVYSLVVGTALVCLPWCDFWGNNLLLYQYPGLRPFVLNPFLKGAVFGLGVVNLLIGIQEIVCLRKNLGNYLSQ